MKKYLLKHPFLLSVAVILGVITQSGLSITALYTMYLIDIITYGNLEELMAATYLGALIVLGFFSSIFIYIRIVQKYLLKTMVYFKKDVFNSIMEISISDFSKENSSKYISLMNNDIETIETNYINAILSLSKDIASFLISFLIMMLLSPLNALLSLVFATLPLIIPFILGKKLSETQMNFMSKKANFTSVIKDFFIGFEVIKTFNAEKKISEKFEIATTNVENSRYEAGIETSKAGIWTGTLMLFTQFSTIIVAGYLVMINIITIGTVVALTSLSASMGGPIQFISINLSNIKSTREIRDNILNISKNKKSKERNSKSSNIKNIVLKDLSFSYDTKDSEEQSKKINKKPKIFVFDGNVSIEEALKRAGVSENEKIMSPEEAGVDISEILKNINIEEEIKKTKKGE